MNTAFWEKIQQGDEEVFRQLYNGYSDLLYGYGMKIAGDDNLVTESTQSLLVYLYEGRQSCSEPQFISTYLCVALKRMLPNELRETASGVLTSLDGVSSSRYRSDLEIGIETVIARSELEKEQLEVLQKGTDGLTKQQREVLYLEYHRKLDSDEIAEVMGLASCTVYSTTHMAISRLRERLSKSFPLTIIANLWIFSQDGGMENRRGPLEQYMEDGKLPPKSELFAWESVLGGESEKFRERKHVDTLTSRPNAAGGQRLIALRSSCIYRGVVILFILFFGIGGYYYLSEEKITPEAAAVDYKLPDGSSVKLMWNSALSYNRVSWLWGCKLNLLGLAFFDVTPDETFTVQAETGDATVLGAKFLIEQEGKTITVNYEEGIVKVRAPIGKQTLSTDENVRCDENRISPIQEEEELSGVFGYEDDPLVNVVTNIQHIFDVEVVGCEEYNELYYSGTILMRDLRGTLKKVFDSLGINYQLGRQGVMPEQTRTGAHTIKKRNRP